MRLLFYLNLNKLISHLTTISRRFDLILLNMIFKELLNHWKFQTFIEPVSTENCFSNPQCFTRFADAILTYLGWYKSLK
jgi:hypothetical protein